jgi:hypothetical protein
MRGRNDLWQGCFGYWQSRFTHHHILTIGYTAWKGYVDAGRGLVVCDVVEAVPSTIDWQVDAVAFNRAFIPQAQVVGYLQALDLGSGGVADLLPAIATYDPTQAIVLLITGSGTLDINLLQNLAIAPAECYAQVERRWAEFQPDFIPQGEYP